MANKNGPKEIIVIKHGHAFKILVLRSGKVECSIDNGKPFAVKEINDGKLTFFKKQEIAVHGDLVEIDSLKLSDEDFAAVMEAKEAVTVKKQESPTPKKPAVKAPKLATGPSKNITGVDAWKHRICTYKDKNGVKQKYCEHSFRIGNNKYRFLERIVPDVGVIINPDYKVSDETPDVGGIPKQYGELIFWDYLFPDTGWQRTRPLTNNELICLDIIKKHGVFASKNEPVAEEETETEVS